MSDQAFETSLGKLLRDVPGCWVYHPPDFKMLRTWKPGDWLFGKGSVWGCVEAKEVQKGSYPISRWSMPQRAQARAIEAAGGRYWLVVRYQPSGVVAAFRGRDLGSSGGLKPGDGITLSSGRTVDLAPLFA